MVRRQKRFPTGYNVNLCNLQSVQNKPVHEQSLPKSTVIQVKDSEPRRENKDYLYVGKTRFDWSGYFASLAYPQEKASLPLLSCHPELLRRPTKRISPPLKETEIVFKNFSKQLNLETLFFPTIKEQYIFYLKNFPLLLKKKTEEDFVAKTRLKTPSPKPAVSPEIKRGIQLKYRLLHLQRKLDELEKQEPDIVFETELRNSEFDPTTWECNKLVWPFYIPKPTRESRRRKLISPEYL